MRNAKFILMGVAMLLIIGNISIIDFTDLSWSSNSGSYLSIMAMILLVISIIITMIEKKKS